MIIYTLPSEGNPFYMRVTNLEKLKMCEDHVLRGKSLSQVSKNSYSIYASWVPNLSNQRKPGQ